MDDSKKLILVVDDSWDICEVVKAQLESANYYVRTANSGDEALQALKKNSVDLVVSDISMPHGNGMELLSNIKKLSSKQPPVVLMTGFSNYSKEQILSSGAAGYMEKPLKIKDLIQMVETILTKSKFTS